MRDSDLRKLNTLKKHRDELEEFLNLSCGRMGLKFSVVSFKIFPWTHTRFHDLELYDYPELVDELLEVIKHHYELICEALEEA